MSSDVDAAESSSYLESFNTQQSRESEIFIDPEDEYAKNHVDAVSLKVPVPKELRTAYNDQYVVYDNSENIREIFLA